MRGLSSDEMNDLFQLVHRVSSVLEDHSKAPAMTVSIQDGAEAGQTVPHVHVHVLPRRKGDLVPNDKIYAQLDSDTREARSAKDKERGGRIESVV